MTGQPASLRGLRWRLGHAAAGALVILAGCMTAATVATVAVARSLWEFQVNTL